VIVFVVCVCSVCVLCVVVIFTCPNDCCVVVLVWGLTEMKCRTGKEEIFGLKSKEREKEKGLQKKKKKKKKHT